MLSEPLDIYCMSPSASHAFVGHSLASLAPPRRFVVRAATAPRRRRVIYKLYIQSCNQTRAFSSCSISWARGQPPPYLPRSRYYTSRRDSKDISGSEDRAERKYVHTTNHEFTTVGLLKQGMESGKLLLGIQFLIQGLQSPTYKIFDRFINIISNQRSINKSRNMYR